MGCTYCVCHFGGYRIFCRIPYAMSKKSIKTLLLVVTLPFAFLGLFGVALAGYFVVTYDDSVDLKDPVEFVSPDGNKKAVLYTAMWGGAAGGTATAVSVLNAFDTLDVSVYRNDNKTALRKRRSDSIEVKWQGDSTLFIRYLDEDEYCVRYKADNIDGVRIIHEPYTLPPDTTRKLELLYP